MKTIILSLLLLIFHYCVAQREPEFGLYFGNDFKSDSVTIFINGVQVVKNIELRNRMYDPKNLMIEQGKKTIIVMPYGQKHVAKKIQVKNSVFLLDIYLTKVWKRFTIDLRKGKYLYARYKFFRLGWSYFKVVDITQETVPPLII